jgi:DNA-binding NarL/FixJ family response regulator
MAAPLRVIIADDHALFRQGLKSMLVNLHPEVTVVGEVDSVAAIVPALGKWPCDVLLLDLQMEDRNALADIRTLAERVRIVVVTASQRADEALAALHAGARAVVFKRFAVETLMEALHAVEEGHVWMPPALQTELTKQISQQSPKTLTSREHDIVRLVGLGFRNAEIAERLSISEVTVKTHLNNIFHKLEIRDRVGLALYAIRLGLIAIHEKVR